MAKIVAVANQKGGVGKTTTNINISAFIAHKGKRVLTIDMDPQGNTSSGLGLRKKPKASIYEALIGHASIKDVIVKTSFNNLSLAPAVVSLAAAELELAALERREFTLKNALDEIADDYDYIFIDCPPSLGLLTINSICAAHSVLIPVQCEYYALEGVGQLMNTINLIRKRLNPRLEIEGVVLTMLDGRTNLGIQVVQEIKRYFRNKVFQTIVPRNVRLSEAPSHGQPIHIYDPKSSGAQAYDALSDEFLSRQKERGR